MSKFQKGDRFRVKKNGFTGTVDCIDYNSTYGENDIYVQWDHFLPNKLNMYSERDAMLDWDKIENSLPRGFTINEAAFGDTAKECLHSWIEVGFMFSKVVCKNCDMEKK